MDRRAFVGMMAAGAGLRVPDAALVPESRLTRIGVQLYTVRALLEQNFEGTLARIAQIGYREVEFAGYFGHTPQQVRFALNQLGLAAPAAHLPFEKLEQGWDAALQSAVVAGHHFVVIPWIPPERRRSLDDWKRLVERFNHAGLACQGLGLQFAYHNQSYEFSAVDGQRPFDLVLETTDAGLVQFELDCYWIAKGGGDPIEYLARYPGRFAMMHVKDMTASGEMADVGQGSIDWARLLARAGDARIRHYFVEHDEPAQPLASIRASYAYLSRLKF